MAGICQLLNQVLICNPARDPNSGHQLRRFSPTHFLPLVPCYFPQMNIIAPGCGTYRCGTIHCPILGQESSRPSQGQRRTLSHDASRLPRSYQALRVTLWLAVVSEMPGPLAEECGRVVSLPELKPETPATLPWRMQTLVRSNKGATPRHLCFPICSYTDASCQTAGEPWDFRSAGRLYSVETALTPENTSTLRFEPDLSIKYQHIPLDTDCSCYTQFSKIKSEICMTGSLRRQL
jgi:hypothetical protein